MKPISKEIAPDLNRNQRTQLAVVVSQYDTRKLLIESISKQYPTLTRKEVKWRIHDLYGLSGPNELPDKFARALYQKGKEKWPSLTPDEVIALIHDGAIASEDIHRRPNSSQQFSNTNKANTHESKIDWEGTIGKVAETAHDIYEFDKKFLDGQLLRLAASLIGL